MLTDILQVLVAAIDRRAQLAKTEAWVQRKAQISNPNWCFNHDLGTIDMLHKGFATPAQAAFFSQQVFGNKPAPGEALAEWSSETPADMFKAARTLSTPEQQAEVKRLVQEKLQRYEAEQAAARATAAARPPVGRRLESICARCIYAVIMQSSTAPKLARERSYN